MQRRAYAAKCEICRGVAGGGENCVAGRGDGTDNVTDSGAVVFFDLKVRVKPTGQQICLARHPDRLCKSLQAKMANSSCKKKGI